MRKLIPIFLLTLLSMTSTAATTQLQGIGRFETLNNPWFLLALYGQTDEHGRRSVERLEMKVVEDKLTVRRFRQLWQDVFAVGADRDQWHSHSDDLSRFLELTRGPLKADDFMVFERIGRDVVVSINYREHSRLSAEFLDVLVSTLTGRIAPIPQLRDGLLGLLPDSEQAQLQRQFSSREPTLGRISETGRWLRKARHRQGEAQVSQL